MAGVAVVEAAATVGELEPSNSAAPAPTPTVVPALSPERRRKAAIAAQRRRRKKQVKAAKEDKALGLELEALEESERPSEPDPDTQAPLPGWPTRSEIRAASEPCEALVSQVRTLLDGTRYAINADQAKVLANGAAPCFAKWVPMLGATPEAALIVAVAVVWGPQLAKDAVGLFRGPRPLDAQPVDLPKVEERAAA